VQGLTDTEIKWSVVRFSRLPRYRHFFSLSAEVGNRKKNHIVESGGRNRPAVIAVYSMQRNERACTKVVVQIEYIQRITTWSRAGGQLWPPTMRVMRVRDVMPLKHYAVCIAAPASLNAVRQPTITPWNVYIYRRFDYSEPL